jgi:hypothetical protein
VTVVWGDPYWEQCLEIDGGSGLLHKRLRTFREALLEVPELGTPKLGTEGHRVLEVELMDPISVLWLTYALIEDRLGREFILLMGVQLAE